jgi:hypothetical protein
MTLSDRDRDKIVRIRMVRMGMIWMMRERDGWKVRIRMVRMGMIYLMGRKTDKTTFLHHPHHLHPDHPDSDILILHFSSKSIISVYL